MKPKTAKTSNTKSKSLDPIERVARELYTLKTKFSSLSYCPDYDELPKSVQDAWETAAVNFLMPTQKQ